MLNIIKMIVQYLTSTVTDGLLYYMPNKGKKIQIENPVLQFTK